MPDRLPARLGEHTSRRPGEGIEFVGVRVFVPGDRQRRINWPATTRRGTLQVSVFTAERVQNVVVGRGDAAIRLDRGRPATL